MRQRATKLLVGLGAALASATMISPPVSVADPGGAHTGRAGTCPDIQVVFARGTNEPPGPGRVGQAFVDSLRSLVGGKSVALYAVDYPASYDFFRAVDGANDARHFVEGVVSSCPQTKVVLGGFSQGAAVVDLITVPGQATFGYGDPLPSDIADHVAAVAVFGNPTNRVGGPLTALSPLFGSKAIDLCNGADPVCSTGNDASAHRVYVESGMAAQAAQFVAHQL
ncbi:cutinase family protein [Mycobacterium sp.]|uniref:cutinase family protein n=1 Tax=Mycobacterium sp. TaxID=1785 RepID=UPI0025DDCA62|nr:cutinase family protein [Mycobacterium sp.]MBW0014595.1 cutinase family protein [Mycobacterium sp.]